MKFLTVSNLCKRFGDVKALDGVNFTASRQDIIGVVGPSGAGKSTLLHILSGTTSATSGEIHLNGKSLLDVDPAKRNIGIVPQEYLLFPHLNVWENVAFGLKVRGRKPIEIRARVDDLL